MDQSDLFPQDKVCKGCGKRKPASDYFIDKRRKDSSTRGLFHVCKECTAESTKDRRSRDPEKFRKWERESWRRRFQVNAPKKRENARKWNLKYIFGITLEQFYDLFDQQKGLCAICFRQLVLYPAGRGSRESACVDHDHKTGVIRGMLCNHCNAAIGLFAEKPEVLERAAAYLKEEPKLHGRMDRERRGTAIAG
jgi:hypothetical protein